MQGPWSKDRQGRIPEHLAVSCHILNLPDVLGNGLGCPRPECVQRRTYEHTFQNQVIHVRWVDRSPSNVLTLAIWALKGYTQMISRAGLSETELVIDFR